MQSTNYFNTNPILKTTFKAILISPGLIQINFVHWTGRNVNTALALCEKHTSKHANLFWARHLSIFQTAAEEQD
jgi:hypothetical protein